MSSALSPVKHNLLHDSGISSNVDYDYSNEYDSDSSTSSSTSSLTGSNNNNNKGNHIFPPHQRQQQHQQHQHHKHNPAGHREMDIERFISENLNEHKQGLLGRAVPISNMLSWTKDLIQKPMIRTENKTVKKEALEVFKLIQSYMGDKKARDTSTNSQAVVAVEIMNKGWSCMELRDEIYIQLCRQTTRNPKESSLLLGWELMALCLGFLPPSTKFQSYLDRYITRTLETRDFTDQGHLHKLANACIKRLEKICSQTVVKHRPTLEEVEHSKRFLIDISMFGASLDDIIDLQKDRHPTLRIPWIQKVLSECLLELTKDQLTEGIFRVPGDTEEVNVLKSKCESWLSPSSATTDPHILASLLKLWYRELHEPLIPTEFYDLCVESYANPDSAIAIMDKLPEPNKVVLMYLIRFLQKFSVAEVSNVTKMDASNLSMVMAPNCLRCLTLDPQSMFENARKEMNFLKLLVLHLDTSSVADLLP
ncbi:hypothetical protein HELRODRAFT_106880 [Helobdella robusta]|uniref:Rho-GAP domain-containing protein n=1 Tax=Helobdella robusta TaxID=6412 RepID=T1EE56_HELRO|nr:hypothetical protein HELRODRAFT_106880 [Helobdella robusta]ESN98614.1 hypothetical protein HELRODRAFT_106880 [Helobdella robusta]